jgi:hypothetical protein
MTKLTTSDIRAVAREVCRRVVAPAATVTDREAVFPLASIQALGEAGLLGILIPEEHGGAGLGLRELTTTAEVIASACPSSALVTVAHWAATSTITAAGDTDLHKRVLAGLASGTLLGGFAVHESSSGCMALPIETRAVRVGDGFVLSGAKPFVTAVNHLDVVVALADLEAAGPSLFVVDTDLRGVSRGKPETSLGLRGAVVAELALDGCTVRPDSLLGEGGDGLKLLRRTIGTVARFGVAGAALGIARAAQEAVIDHARTRVTGGYSLIERPAVAASIAEISMAADSIDAILSHLLEGTVRDPEQSYNLAAKAKLYASERAVDVARHALQITGGNGYFGAAGVERFLRDALGLTVHLGPPAVLREEVGRSESAQATQLSFVQRHERER